MIRSTPLITLLTISIALISCSDDNAGPSKRPLLAGKTWITVGYEVNGDDAFEGLDECDLDNTTTFFDDGTFLDDMGDVLCDEFDEDSEGTWELKGNESFISIRPTGEPASDWKIEALTETTLRMSQYVDWLEAEVVVEMAPI